MNDLPLLMTLEQVARVLHRNKAEASRWLIERRVAYVPADTEHGDDLVHRVELLRAVEEALVVEGDDGTTRRFLPLLDPANGAPPPAPQEPEPFEDPLEQPDISELEIEEPAPAKDPIEAALVALDLFGAETSPVVTRKMRQMGWTESELAALQEAAQRDDPSGWRDKLRTQLSSPAGRSGLLEQVRSAMP